MDPGTVSVAPCCGIGCAERARVVRISASIRFRNPVAVVFPLCRTPLYPFAAIIVTHNSADAIGRCLASLGEADELVVVDNASADGTADAVASSQAVLIRN